MSKLTVETVQAGAPFQYKNGPLTGKTGVGYKMRLRGESGVTDVEWARLETSPSPKVGEELDGEINQDQRGYWKFKQTPKGGGGGKDFKADPVKLAAENKRSCLHAAKDLAVAGKIEVSEIGKHASKFHKWIEQDA